jgi:cell division protein FtsB
MVLGVLIALQMKNVNADNVTEQRLENLYNNLVDYSKKNEELSKRNAELFSYIELLEQDYASGNAYIESIIKERERAAVFAS